MKLSDLKIDARRRQDGDWVPLGDFDGRIKVRGARNFDWLKVLETETRRVATRDSVRGGLDPKQQREVQIECILQAGLIDWDGPLFTDDDGKTIAYSPEKAAEIYKDPEFEVLVDLTAAACEAMAFASAEQEKAEAKLTEALLWHLEWGDRLQFLLDLAEMGEAPKALVNRPEVHDHLHLHWSAFWELDTCRPQAFDGLASIPWTAIDAWARRHRVEADQFNRLSRLIAAMDATAIDFIQKRQKRNDKRRSQG